jgi:HSP20 family molecular chaperone IbpA
MAHRTDPTDWMWAHAVDLLSQAERMHRQFFRLQSSSSAQAVWEPPADVFEDDREVVVVVALPGVVAERVEVTTEHGAISVRAERPQPLAGSSHAIRQLEIPYGRFARRIPLPGVRLEPTSTELTHGCLVVRLAKIAQGTKR